MLNRNALARSSGFVKLALLSGILIAAGCGKKQDAGGGGSGNAPGSSAPSGGGITAGGANGVHGVTGTEIRIGQTMPYSGPASAYGVIGKVEVAYFKMVNDKGGIKGRKVNLLSLDDGYAPPRAVEQTRKLVEGDDVAFIFGTVGTGGNSATQKLLNDKGVPQLFVATGADKWANPKDFKWTMGWQPSYREEARIYARYISKEKPDAKVCLLYQNDDFGKDYLTGLKEGFGDKADKFIVKTASYEYTDPTIDSQVVSLQGAGCDVLVSATTPKFGANTIRKVADIGWKPLFFMSNVAISITAVLTPAGLDKSTGIISGQYLKDITDPAMASDPGIKDYVAFMKQYAPDIDATDINAVFGYGVAINLQYVLEQCGDDLSRENIMKQAESLKDYKIPVGLDGLVINTSPTDFRPIEQMRLAKFNGKSFEPISQLISGSDQM